MMRGQGPGVLCALEQCDYWTYCESKRICIKADGRPRMHNEINGSLARSETDSMNRLRVEALRERDVALAHVVKIERALSDAASSMEAAIRILSDRKRDHTHRVYEAQAYLHSRIEVIREFMDKELIEPADDRTPRQARDGTDI